MRLVPLLLLVACGSPAVTPGDDVGSDGVAFFPGGAIREGFGASTANEAWCTPGQ